MRIGCIALAMIAACGGKQESATQTCANAAGNAVDAMVKQARDRLATPLPADAKQRMEERTRVLETAAPRLAAVITNRCVDDRWSPASVACYAKAGSLDEQRACRKGLSPEQQAKLQKDELDLIAGTTGPQGFGSAAPAAPVTQAERRLAALRHEINDAMKAVAAATTDDARARAQAALDALVAERNELEHNAESERAPLGTPPVPAAP